MLLSFAVDQYTSLEQLVRAYGAAATRKALRQLQRRALTRGFASLTAVLAPGQSARLRDGLLHLQSAGIGPERLEQLDAWGVLCAGGAGRGEWLYAVDVYVLTLSAALRRVVFLVGDPEGQQERVVLTWEDICAYARVFAGIVPGMKTLASGTSTKVWTCLYTPCPVLALGVVGPRGLSLRQQELVYAHHLAYAVRQDYARAGEEQPPLPAFAQERVDRANERAAREAELRLDADREVARLRVLLYGAGAAEAVMPALREEDTADEQMADGFLL